MKNIGDTVKYENELYTIIDSHFKREKSLGLRIGGDFSKRATKLTLRLNSNKSIIIENVDSKKVSTLYLFASNIASIK